MVAQGSNSTGDGGVAVEGLRPALLRLRRRANLALWSAELARLAAPALLALGLTVLLLRFGLGWAAPRALAVLALLALLPLAAWWRARPRFLSGDGAAAWLDLRTGGRGVVVTGVDVPDPRWSAAVRAELARAPADPRLRLGRPYVASLPGVALVVLAALVRPPVERPDPWVRALENAADRVADRLETLEEQVTLEPELAEELHERLEALREDLADAQPESSLEALDRLDADLAERAQQAFEDALEADAGLDAAAAEASAESEHAALEEALSDLAEAGLLSDPPEALDEALSELAARTGASFESSLTLPEGLDLSGLDAVELSAELQAMLAEKMAELDALGLLGPGHAGRFGEPGELGNPGEYVEHECDADCDEGGT